MSVRLKLRSLRRVNRHAELIQLLLEYPYESKDAMLALGVGDLAPASLSQKQEKRFINEIKERVNGTDHSR